LFFFFSSGRRHTRFSRDWSSDVCSSDLAAHAKNLGQDYIPVHIFPIRYNVPRSVRYLENFSKDDHELKKFAERLSDAFEYFEKHKQLPVVMINDKGEYIINGSTGKKAEAK